MKRTFLFAAACFLAGSVCVAQKSLKLKNSADSVSYLIGMMTGSQFAENIRQAPIEDFNFKVNVAGYTAAVLGEKTLMSPEEAQRYLQDYFTALSAKEVNENKQKGERFLAQNKLEPGVTQTASGLQYKVITQGNGAKPTAADKVTVHYKGTTLDGTTFDSSYERNAPATFPLGQVIRGWTEGVQLMPVGSKYLFWIPSDLAYGDRGAGADIKPGETLVFEVELLSIEEEPKEEAEEAEAVVDTTFRRVGDYERINPQIADIEMEGMEIAYRLKDYVVVLLSDQVKIMDKDQNEIFAATDSLSPIDEVALYLPLQEKSPYIVAATRTGEAGDRKMIDVYLVDQEKNTVVNAGRMNIGLASDVVTDEKREAIFYMNINKQKSDLVFSFDAPYLICYGEGEATLQVPTSDFFFAYTKKKGIHPKGEATKMSFFKKK